MAYKNYRFLWIVFVLACSQQPPETALKVGLFISQTPPTPFQNNRLNAAKLAAERFNQNQTNSGSKLKIELVLGSLGNTPEETLSQMQSFYDQKIQYILGPPNTQYVFASLPFAQKYNLLLLSGSSTSPSLAIPEDNLFRMLPNDQLQTQILASQIKKDNIQNIILLQRNDLYGEDFSQSLIKNLEASNAQFTHKIVYEPTTTEFEPHINEARDMIQQAQLNHAQTAIVLITLEEAPLLIQSMLKLDKAFFEQFRLYGCDGNAQLSNLIEDTPMAQFLIKTHFTATSPWISKELQKGYEQLAADLQIPLSQMNIHTATAYDAVWLYGQVAQRLYHTQNNQIHEIDIFKATLPMAAKETIGITGNLTLDEYGDRKTMPYGFFAIRPLGQGYEWYLKNLETMGD